MSKDNPKDQTQVSPQTLSETAKKYKDTPATITMGTVKSNTNKPSREKKKQLD